MHLNQLEHFVATIENGSFAGAAKKSFLTPQGIEKSIHNLEKELDGDFFEPAGRRYQPTSLGKSLYQPMFQMVALREHLLDIVSSYKNPTLEYARLRVAATMVPRRFTWLTHHALDMFVHDHPTINISLSLNSNVTCLAAVKAGVVDAAVVVGPINDGTLHSRRLFLFPVRAAMSESNPLASFPPQHLSLEALANFPIAMPIDTHIYYRTVKKAFSEAGVMARFVNVDSASERSFLAQGGIILVANRTSITNAYSSTVVRDIAERDRIVMPVCYIEGKGMPKTVSRRLASYLALIGERAIGIDR